MEVNFIRYFKQLQIFWI